MTAAAIVTRSLTKPYGELTALDSFDLEVEQGSIFGLLGPNGAGNPPQRSRLIDCHCSRNKAIQRKIECFFRSNRSHLRLGKTSETILGYTTNIPSI